MEIDIIMNVVYIVFMILAGGFVTYYKTNNKLKNKVCALIADAEEMYFDTIKSGGVKHEFVVNGLYSFVPSVMKPFFTKQIITMIVNEAFIDIEKYAKTQTDKIVNK